MFTKTNNYKDKYSKCFLSINELLNIVKNNPQSNLIENMRLLEYKSDEYNKIKSKLNCITPHGCFNQILNDGLINLSGYLYYDIDNFENEIDMEQSISKLINEFPISFLQRSVSNRGYHFFIKYDTNFDPNDTFCFSNIHTYVFNLLSDKGFVCDSSAKGLCRRMVISSDSNVYFNDKVSLGSIKVSHLESLNNSRQIKKIIKKETIKPNDTLSNSSIIPIDILKTQIKLKNEYEKDIKGDYIIDDMDFHFIYIPEFIKDGNKRKTYRRIINGLYYINNNITRKQVLSYLYFINDTRATPKMNIKELIRLVEYVCDRIESTGEINIKTRTKKIHFSKNSNLDKKQKMKMGASINGRLRRNETIKRIKEAREQLLKNNQDDTQKNVMNLTGLSIATIKRNWNIDYLTTDIDIPKKEEIFKTQIDFNDFIDNKNIDVVKFKYRGFEEVSIERKVEDKEEFKNALKYIKNEFGDVSESLITTYLENKNWNKYKINYYYSKWLDRVNTNL